MLLEKFSFIFKYGKFGWNQAGVYFAMSMYPRLLKKNGESKAPLSLNKGGGHAPSPWIFFIVNLLIEFYYKFNQTSPVVASFSVVFTDKTPQIFRMRRKNCAPPFELGGSAPVSLVRQRMDGEHCRYSSAWSPPRFIHRFQGNQCAQFHKLKMANIEKCKNNNDN